MAGEQQPQHLKDLVEVAEDATSITEASVRLQRMGHWYLQPGVVAAYQDALLELGVSARAILSSNLPPFVESAGCPGDYVTTGSAQLHQRVVLRKWLARLAGVLNPPRFDRKAVEDVLAQMLRTVREYSPDDAEAAKSPGFRVTVNTNPLAGCVAGAWRNSEPAFF